MVVIQSIYHKGIDCKLRPKEEEEKKKNQDANADQSGWGLRNT